MAEQWVCSDATSIDGALEETGAIATETMYTGTSCGGTNKNLVTGFPSPSQYPNDGSCISFGGDDDVVINATAWSETQTLCTGGFGATQVGYSGLECTGETVATIEFKEGTCESLGTPADDNYDDDGNSCDSCLVPPDRNS